MNIDILNLRSPTVTTTDSDFWRESESPENFIKTPKKDKKQHKNLDR